MQGKIVKGIAGFYYVHVEQVGIYECKAKGVFRNQKRKPLVGDDVQIDSIDEQKKLGTIVDILNRKNELIRPAVANVDQAVIIFAAAQPNPNLNLLDRFLLMMNKQQVNTIICFNKVDIVENKTITSLSQTYKSCGYHVIFVSTYEEVGIQELQKLLIGKTSVLAGPSGVGKSSIMNMIYPKANVKIGEISEKIKRGKHTTRHSELISIGNQTYIMDTPGFSSLYIDQFSKNELKNYFVEFEQYEGKCRFHGCVHINEPDCAVKHAVQEEKISGIRYQNYVEMYHEIEEQRSW